MLEQDPGRELVACARETGTGLIVRVPHSSGLLEGKYTAETTFPPNDHRSHRPREWLVEGLQKVEALRFLTEDRPHTLGQVALKWLLAEETVVTTLPNVYGIEQLEEFAAAPDLPDLSPEDLARIEELYGANFGVVPAGAGAGT
jgi:aryl-alcohol dehydrogenase-like predicted oxidoreductase